MSELNLKCIVFGEVQIDSNSMSTHLRVFLCQEVRELYSYSHFFCSCFLSVFFLFCTWLCDIKYSYFKQIYGTLTSTTTLSLSGPGSNGDKGIFYIPQSWSLIIRCSLVSYLGHPFFDRVLPFCQRYRIFKALLTGLEVLIDGKNHINLKK